MTPLDLLAHADSGSLWPWPTGATAWTTLPGAYRAALAVRDLRAARGEIPRGYKVGFTNRTIWQRYGVFAPIWGTVWDTTLRSCDGDASLSLDRLCQPRIEPEAVFGLRTTPGLQAGLDGLFEALEWVAPGFEIVQSHLPGWKFTAPETVADGGLHGRLLVGRRVPVSELAGDAAGLADLLAGTRVELRQDGVTVETGVGANVLDSPLHALLHFAGELRACPGAPDLVAGDLVTTGTWTDAWPVLAGQHWSAHFSAGLPSLSVSFT